MNTAILAFGAIKAGVVAPSGSTSAAVDRSFLGLQNVLDRALAELRLDGGHTNTQIVSVRELFDEVTVGASLIAQTRGGLFLPAPPDPTVCVQADRQMLASALVNLLQNAFELTRPGAAVELTATVTGTRVLIEVADSREGPPPAIGADQGLSISMKAARASGGELRVRQVPPRGCVFTLDLPRVPPPRHD